MPVKADYKSFMEALGQIPNKPGQEILKPFESFPTEMTASEATAGLSIEEHFKTIPRSERRRIDNNVRKYMKKQNKKKRLPPPPNSSLYMDIQPAPESDAILLERNNRSKGQRNGVCARAACEEKPATYYNFSTERWYCSKCALEINIHSLENALDVYGHELCLPAHEIDQLSSFS